MSSPTPSSANGQSVSPKEGDSLGVEQCRQLLGWTDASDKEIEQFLLSLRGMLGRFVDDCFRESLEKDL